MSFRDVFAADLGERLDVSVDSGDFYDVVATLSGGESGGTLD